MRRAVRARVSRRRPSETQPPKGPALGGAPCAYVLRRRRAADPPRDGAEYQDAGRARPRHVCGTRVRQRQRRCEKCTRTSRPEVRRTGPPPPLHARAPDPPTNQSQGRSCKPIGATPGPGRLRARRSVLQGGRGRASRLGAHPVHAIHARPCRVGIRASTCPKRSRRKFNKLGRTRAPRRQQ